MLCLCCTTYPMVKYCQPAKIRRQIYMKFCSIFKITWSKEVTLCHRRACVYVAKNQERQKARGHKELKRGHFYFVESFRLLRKVKIVSIIRPIAIAPSVMYKSVRIFLSQFRLENFVSKYNLSNYRNFSWREENAVELCIWLIFD